jgi:hypothetical protein
MMDNLPVHIRIAILTPSNEDVDARKATIVELAKAWGKISDVNTILHKSEVIAESLGGDGQPSDALGSEVQAILQKHASAFLYEESPMDVGVCAGLAAKSVITSGTSTSGWTIAEVYSNALWSALSFQPTLEEEKRERLRREVLDAAQQRSRAAADKARERITVPDMADLTLTIAEATEPTTNFKKATSATIDALIRNAALDREELDFLWWVQLSRSRLLNRLIAGMPEPLRLVTSGIEAAGHLRRLPADVHYDLTNRTVDGDPELNLPELIEAIGEDRHKLVSSANPERIAAHPSVFPLHHALLSGGVDAVGADVKRKASQWGGRALLEAGLLRMCDKGVMKL